MKCFQISDFHGFIESETKGTLSARLTAGPGWAQSPVCRGPHKTQQKKFKSHRSYIFLKVVTFLESSDTWTKNVWNMPFILVSLAEVISLKTWVLAECYGVWKPDSAPWNTDTDDNKTTVQPQSLKSLCLLFLLAWFCNTAFCFGANLLTCSR